MVVPLPAGGTADLLCRLAAEKASQSLKQQVIVENRPGGAGGRIGTEQVMRATPDGHTVLCGTQLIYSITHLVFTKQAFDTRSMEPVSVLATYPLILIARGNLPADDLPGFIAYAKANPGKVNYGHQGKGNTGSPAGRTPDAQGRFPHDGNSVSRQRAGDQRSARRQHRHGPRLSRLPTSRTSTPASSSSWRPEAASGSRIMRRSRPSPRRCRAFTPIPGWRWRRRPARRRRSRRGSPTRSGRASRRRTCASASWRWRPSRSAVTPEQMRELIEISSKHWSPVVDAAKISID